MGRLGNNSLYLRLLLIAGGIIILGFFAHWFEINILRIEEWIKSLGALAPFAFVLLFTIATPLFLSVDVLCLASGVLFPLTASVIYIIISTYLAATVIFILGRYFFQDKVKVVLAKYPKFEHIDTLLVDNSYKIMFLLRLFPLPFALLSYAFSVTEVKFKPYIISTSGILIYNISLVYFGYTAKHIASSVSSGQSLSSLNYPLLVAGAIVIFIFLAIAVHQARKIISQMNPEIIKLEQDKD